MPHLGQEMITISGTHEFASFGEFMIHSFMIYALHNLSVLVYRFMFTNYDCLSGLV